VRGKLRDAEAERGRVRRGRGYLAGVVDQAHLVEPGQQLGRELIRILFPHDHPAPQTAVTQHLPGCAQGREADRVRRSSLPQGLGTHEGAAMARQRFGQGPADGLGPTERADVQGAVASRLHRQQAAEQGPEDHADLFFGGGEGGLAGRFVHGAERLHGSRTGYHLIANVVPRTLFAGTRPTPPSPQNGMVPCPPCPAPPRNPFSVARLRRHLVALDRALVVAADPGPLLARAAALGRGGDPDTRHGARVAALAGALARALGLPASFAGEIAPAAELHDVGKVVLPRALLVKRGPLSPVQRRQLAMHTCAATWLFAETRHPVLRLAATVARSHHERWDGAGYPDGTGGDRIPLPARIVAAADVWDALTHDRPYRPALTNDGAAALVRQMRGTALDPDLVDALLPLVL
jgi:hypothetical protein